MRILSVLMAIIFLSACTTYPNSLSYRPKGSDKNPYIITSELNQITREIFLFINGEKVTEGKLSFVDGTGEFYGTYDGQNVNLSCRRGVDGCMVLINNELAGIIS